MAPHLQKFCGRLVKQGFFPVKELEAIYRAWRATAPNARDDVQSFVNFLALRGSASLEKLQALIDAPSITSSAKSEEEFEVELIAVPDPRRIGRRDFFLFAIGTATGGLLVAAAGLAFRLINR